MNLKTGRKPASMLMGFAFGDCFPVYAFFTVVPKCFIVCMLCCCDKQTYLSQPSSY